MTIPKNEIVKRGDRMWVARPLGLGGVSGVFTTKGNAMAGHKAILKAFEAGRDAKADEIREALGVPALNGCDP